MNEAERASVGLQGGDEYLISPPIISYLRSIKNLYSMCIQKELESDWLETIQEFRYGAFHFWAIFV